MKINKKIQNRLNELIEEGKKILDTKFNVEMIADTFVDAEMTCKWYTNVQNILSRSFGKESIHYKNFSDEFKRDIKNNPGNIVCGLGVLEAAKKDYEDGYFFDMKHLIEAEVFDDFLEQAEYLLKSKYYQPAVVIAGCVLEDGLRKLCKENNINLPEKPKIYKMNADLTKIGIFTKLTQKKITYLADLRNNAAHGTENNFNEEDVKNMINDVRRILEEKFI